MNLDWLNSLLSVLDKIQGLPAAALVVATCIVVGYALRFIKTFPNDGIPVVVILWGGAFMLLLADPRANDMPMRIWTFRNFALGLIFGTMAWLLHNYALRKLETYVGGFLGKGGQTPPTDPPSTP